MSTLFLLNPTAGKQDCTAALRPQIEAAAARAGLDPSQLTILCTQYAGHARAVAQKAAEQAAQAGQELRIFTAGGDGTFMEAMTGARGFSGTAVGCLPYGSGNDFLRTYGVREEFLDLDAQVAYGIPKFRRIPFCGGEMAYILSIVQQICGHIGRTIRYQVDDEVITADSMMCAVCNGRAYGGGFFAAPEAQPDDGWLDVYIVRTAGRLTIAKLLGMYKNGRHFVDGQLTEEARPYFIYRRAKKVSLTPVDGRGPIVATADGECASIDQVDVQLCPLEGRILLPLPVYQRFMERPADVGSTAER